jgi:hypothetical protein
MTWPDGFSAPMTPIRWFLGEDALEVSATEGKHLAKTLTAGGADEALGEHRPVEPGSGCG